MAGAGFDSDDGEETESHAFYSDYLVNTADIREIRGVASWEGKQQTEWIEIRLFWYTEGKGARDAQIVDRLRSNHPPRSGSRDCCFDVPEAPYSFRAKLITLRWAIELVSDAQRAVERVEIFVSPDGDEVTA